MIRDLLVKAGKTLYAVAVLLVVLLLATFGSTVTETRDLASAGSEVAQENALDGPGNSEDAGAPAAGAPGQVNDPAADAPGQANAPGQTDAGDTGGPTTTSGGNGTGDLPTEDNDGDGVANVPDPSGDADNQHPSGKDKHADNGQTGKSPSDPDGDSNGGPDKPGGSGGEDIYDQDGNNGCGNDDDFEDDNNGNCGKPRKDECPNDRDHGRGNDRRNCAVEATPAPNVTPTPTARPAGSSENRPQQGGVDTDTGVNDSAPNGEGLPSNNVVSGPNDAPGESEDLPDLGPGMSDVEEIQASPSSADEVLGALTSADEADVLGKKVTNDSVAPARATSPRPSLIGAVLPFTGNATLWSFLILAAGFITSGLVIARQR